MIRHDRVRLSRWTLLSSRFRLERSQPARVAHHFVGRQLADYRPWQNPEVSRGFDNHPPSGRVLQFEVEWDRECERVDDMSFRTVCPLDRCPSARRGTLSRKEGP